MKKVKLFCAIIALLGIVALLAMSVLTPHGNGKIAFGLFIFVLINAMIADIDPTQR